MLCCISLVGCYSENDINPVLDNNQTDVGLDTDGTLGESPQIDVLLVLDNSCSMITDWDYLTYGLTQIPVELNQNNFDWRLALISMDSSDGIFMELSPADPDPGWTMISLVSDFKDQAGGQEYGFLSALSAKIAYRAWFRPTVTTLIFFISDEREQSEIAPIDFHQTWSDPHITASMVGPRTMQENVTSCAEADEKWHDASQIVIDICTTERWSVVDYILP